MIKVYRSYEELETFLGDDEIAIDQMIKLGVYVEQIDEDVYIWRSDLKNGTVVKSSTFCLIGNETTRVSARQELLFFLIILQHWRRKDAAIADRCD